jgi:hypothetical protein
MPSVTYPSDPVPLLQAPIDADSLTVFLPPIVSTYLKSPSLASTPTGTFPAPQATQVPTPNVVPGLVDDTDIYIEPTG